MCSKIVEIYRFFNLNKKLKTSPVLQIYWKTGLKDDSQSISQAKRVEDWPPELRIVLRHRSKGLPEHKKKFGRFGTSSSNYNY